MPAREAEGNMIENAAQYHLLGVTTTLILIYMYICTQEPIMSPFSLWAPDVHLGDCIETLGPLQSDRLTINGRTDKQISNLGPPQ